MNVIMPQLGETVEAGTVSVWHKKVGDQVKAGDDLLDISTDKVEMEIPVPVTGVITQILVGEGETVAVGVTLAIINDGKEAAAAPAAVTEAPAPQADTPGKSVV